MNDNTRVNCTRRRRPGRVLACILTAVSAGIAVLAAACGSGGSPAGENSAGGKTPYQRALAYVLCMHAHGEPGFPLPTSQGGISFGPVNINSAAYISADKSCQYLFSGGTPSTAAQRLQHVTQALQFAACIRSHGVPDFPDPVIVQGGTAVGFKAGSVDENAPQIQAAEHACARFEPGLSALGGTP
jgi:hypothetical protein